MYHQAVMAQHSSLLKDLMLRCNKFNITSSYGRKMSTTEKIMCFICRTGCCKCLGEECRRISDDVVVRFSYAISPVYESIVTLSV